MIDCSVMYWKKGFGEKNTRKKNDTTNRRLSEKNYTDLKKAAEDRSIWRIIRKDS